MRYKWDRLVEAMQAEGVYYAPRLNQRLLQKSYYSGRSVIRETDRPWRHGVEIEAHITRLKTLDPAFEEIALAYVQPHLRGNGILSDIFRELVLDAPTEISLFLIAKDPAMFRIADQCHFRPVNRKVMPLVEAWAEAIGLRERLPATALGVDDSQPKAGERWLFMR